jgi:TolB protein
LLNRSTVQESSPTRLSRFIRWLVLAVIKIVLLTLAALLGTLPLSALADEWRSSAPAASIAGGTSSAIAYTNGNEIRLIDPDGSNDRFVWSLTGPAFNGITSLAWKPDATEITFASDLEATVSFYEQDLYAIRPDGSGLRKLTNAPLNSQLAAYPKGDVTVTVSNMGCWPCGGPFLIYVTGASEPQSIVLPPGSSQTLTFTDVADFGPTGQPVVAIEGPYRWFNSAVADVQPGQTVHAGTLFLAGEGIWHFGADKPFWRHDGSKVGFIRGAGCSIQQALANPPAGFADEPLLQPNVSGFTCLADWAPLPSLANQLLYDDYLAEGHIYRTTEGSSDPGELLLTYSSIDRMLDLKWLPDGSGFLFVKTGDFNANSNIYEYTFTPPSVTQITNFTDEFAGYLSLSPDGQYVVFERAPTMDSMTDLWLMQRDGSDMRLLVSGAMRPAWSSQAPQIPEKVYLPGVLR